MNQINIFDFDGTLTTDSWPKCWVWIKKVGYNGEKRNNDFENALAEYRTTHFGDPFETFFGFFEYLLKDNNTHITYEELMEGEKYIDYNPGVIDFIKNTDTKNYIISCGLKEFIENLKYANLFDDIYGTLARYNDNGLIIGINEVFTNKKKVLAIKDILKKNNRKENDCSNVFYVGDGYFDALAMEYVHNNGGKAIFVYQPTKDGKMDDDTKKIYETINANNIVDYCCVADYTAGSELYNILEKREY